MKDVAIKIKDLRLKVRVNQSQIAKTLGISTPAYSKIESGITEINISRLRQIAKYFNVEAAWFLQDVENPNDELIEQKRVVSELRGKLIKCLENKLTWKE